MTPTFITANAPPSLDVYYPVTNTRERRRQQAAPFVKYSEAWLSRTLKADKAARPDLDGTNLGRCTGSVNFLWKTAERVLAERFYTMSLDAAEFGSAGMHEVAALCMGERTINAAYSALYKQFHSILALRMTDHLLARQYVNTYEEEPSAPFAGLRDIDLFGHSANGLYHNEEKVAPDALVLGGKLIAEAEGLLLEMADGVRQEAAQKSGTAAEKLTFGLPDTLPAKHWGRRSVIDGIIDEEKAYARMERARVMSKACETRIAKANSLAMSRGELGLKNYFAPATKEPAE